MRDEFCKREMRDLSLGFAERKILVSLSVVNGDGTDFIGPDVNVISHNHNVLNRTLFTRMPGAFDINS